jgi:rifampicin phosphotransferase
MENHCAGRLSFVTDSQRQEGAAMESTSTGLVRSLDDIGLADIAQVGSKAANLGELKRAGLPVPEGVVITTEALSRALASAGLDAAASPEDVEAMALDTEFVAAVSTAIEELGGGPFAVRSSGVAEDLPGASFAGQYETVLNAETAQVPAAVRHCWASAFSRRVDTYRQSRGEPRRQRWPCSSCPWFRPTQLASPSAPTRSAAAETRR